MLIVTMLVSGCGGLEITETGDTVKVHYTGRLQDGTVFDKSVGSEPLEFTLGQRQMIPGFEQAIIGMKAGESKTVTIPVDEAYGPRRDDMIVETERSELSESIDPQIGMHLQMTQSGGSIIVVTIIDISETTITIDANHALAGHDLIFDIELVEIKKSQSGQTASDFTSTPLGQVLDNGLPTLAEFGSSTCVPCKQMKPILSELSKEYEDKLNVVIVEVYEQKELAQQYKIMTIPTQIFFNSEGQEVIRHMGFFAKEDISTQLQEMGIE
ncbi:FKBP-type peptidyl-prolyl cis-trans isomerase [Chloroflexota bacterium]